jgi:hypothetical protein
MSCTCRADFFMPRRHWMKSPPTSRSGILADTWYDLLQEVAKQAVDDAAFRAPLPIGYAFEDTGFAENVKETLERFASWVAHLDPDAISRARRERFWHARTRSSPASSNNYPSWTRSPTPPGYSDVPAQPCT